MMQDQIKQLIAARVTQDGLTETGIPGVKLFRAIQAVPCVPAVYEPSIIAIVSGVKEAVLDGRRFVYDNSQYLCCPMSMPVEAGTPHASSDNPLFGVYIALNPRIINELVMGLEAAGAPLTDTNAGVVEQGIRLANWTPAFSDALLRLLQLGESEADTAVLGELRLREVYYAVLQGEAGAFARHAFGAGNAIARSITHAVSHLDSAVSVEEMAARAGMSRAVFHRKFKQATSLSPMQFVKSIRLNHAATQIAEGKNVSEAALDAGYVSPSQFSREFKRMYGQTPRQWGNAQQPAAH